MRWATRGAFIACGWAAGSGQDWPGPSPPPPFAHNGRLADVLRDEGALENTILIYISDNGAAFPEAKTTLYEPGMNLPCIVRRPGGGNRGGTCDALVTWADLTPTVLDFAGVESADGSFYGRSFAGVLDEPEPAGWRDEGFAAHTFHEITSYYPMRAVRTQRHKFIWNVAWKLDYPFASDLWECCSWQAVIREGASHFGTRTVDAYLHRPRFELYDLETDPDELNSLADCPEQADLVAGFVEKTRQFQRETSDPWLHKWEYE
jgi:N-sulfoglucosamine sulfohydrolase